MITASKIAHATLLHRLGSSLLGKFFAQMLEITYAEESIVVAENITDKMMKMSKVKLPNGRLCITSALTYDIP